MNRKPCIMICFISTKSWPILALLERMNVISTIKKNVFSMVRAKQQQQILIWKMWTQCLTRTLAVCRIHHVRWIRSRLHHRILRGHSRILWRHWITCVWILRGSQWFSIGVIHGLHWIVGHGDLLGCGSNSTECYEGKINPYCLHTEASREQVSPSNGVLPVCCLLW